MGTWVVSFNDILVVARKGNTMRYHYEKPSVYLHMYGQTYKCNHDVYSECTLYLIGDRGLAVIQQRYDPDTKKTWWGVIDDWLVDDLYFTPSIQAIL